MASKSAFSEGGRVLDQYRSALNPENVEAFICTEIGCSAREVRVLIESLGFSL